MMAGALCALATLASCSDEETEQATGAPADPLIQRALNAPLMTDPDLASLNEANAALTVNYEQTLPPVDRSERAIAAARDASRLLLLERGAIPNLPEPKPTDDLPDLVGAMTALDVAKRIGFASDCTNDIGTSAIWAADLPQYADIVVRGSVMDAAGSDRAGCQVRIVRYLTPMEIEDVALFHYANAKRLGFDLALVGDAERAIIGRDDAGARLHVQMRETGDGLVAVDIALRLEKG